MKTNFKYIIFLLVAAMGVSSCTDMLDEEPKSIIYGNSIKSEKELDLAVLGAYRGLTQSIYFKKEMPVNGLGSAGADIWEIHKNVTNAKFCRFLYTPDNTDVKKIWLDFYTVINRANTVVDAAEALDIPAEKKNPYIGEAKFLRAFCYFELVKNFGGVPLRVKHTTSVVKDSDVKRATEQEVYNQIFEDLQYAEENMKATGAPGRATKWTAKAYLAKAYLACGGYPVNNYQDKTYFEKAAAKALEVINSGAYTLNPTNGDSSTPDKTPFYQYGKQFLPSGENSKESIFELQFKEGEFGGGWGYRSVLGGQTFDVSDYGKYFYYYGGYNLSSDFAMSFDDQDIRFQWSIAPYRIMRGKRVPQFVKQWTFAKYRVEDKIPGNAWANDVDFIAMRLAEVYLIYAEAYNEAYDKRGAAVDGLSMTAFEAINQVRERAHVTPMDEAYLNAVSPYSNGGTNQLAYGMSLESFDKQNPNYDGRHVYYEGATEQERFRNAVLMERAWELCFEGQRYLDVRRMGKLKELVKAQHVLSLGKLTSVSDPIDKSDFAVNQFPINDKKEYYNTTNYIDLETTQYLPIPQHEIDYNGAISNEDQNPGY